MALEEIVALLEFYGYLALFPIAIIEGPIITVIAGFLVSVGVFNPLIVYLVVVVGDILGDAFWYLLGRTGSQWRLTAGVKRFFGITQEKIEEARRVFEQNRYKMMLASKLVHGVGSAGLIAAGVARVPYLLFASTCFIVTLAQAAFFLGLGILFGEAYERIALYIDYAVAVIFALAAFGAVFYFWRWWRKSHP